MLFLYHKSKPTTHLFKMSIRYWTATDQRNGRVITFSSKSKALDMLAFYQGAGIRCELVWVADNSPNLLRN